MLLFDEPINPSRGAPDAARVKAAIFSAKWANYQGTEPQHYQAQFDHEELDRAVFDAYGWTEDPADLDDDTILERLLELNLSRESV